MDRFDPSDNDTRSDAVHTQRHRNVIRHRYRSYRNDILKVPINGEGVLVDRSDTSVNDTR